MNYIFSIIVGKTTFQSSSFNLLLKCYFFLEQKFNINVENGMKETIFSQGPFDQKLSAYQNTIYCLLYWSNFALLKQFIVIEE